MCFFFHAEDGILAAHYGLEFRRAFFRSVFVAAALVVLLAIRHGRAGFVVPRMGIQFGRGASVAMATLCFYVGVQLMPLADVTAVQFVSPVFVALLSPLMLSERTPVVAWVSTLVAMTGVMIVLRPKDRKSTRLNSSH